MSQTNAQLLADSLGTASTGTVPIGGIILWSGSTGSVPDGWALCNGSNGTPNLQDRFVVGAGSGYAVAATGGSANAVLVTHSHTTDSTINESDTNAKSLTGTFRNDPQPDPTGIFSQTNINHNEDSDQGTNGRLVAIDATHRHTTDSQGESGTNKNLPPYYALAYIMRTS